VVGVLPGRGRPVLVAAHYDTKDLPGFVGANDGAGGVATVLELSRALRQGRRACQRGIRFVMFDGEESPAGSPDAAFLRDGLRGSKAYAAAHADELAAVVVVDFVADRDLALRREQGSDPGLWRLLRDSARRAGTIEAFPSGTQGSILDDHLPFAERGVPAIDLIDFDYPWFHTRQDTLDKVSAASLNKAGEALVEMLQRLARQTCQTR
jgi:Zn-dependent M28 family amino/carboxypeptidase